MCVGRVQPTIAVTTRWARVVSAHFSASPCAVAVNSNYSCRPWSLWQRTPSSDTGPRSGPTNRWNMLRQRRHWNDLWQLLAMSSYLRPGMYNPIFCIGVVNDPRDSHKAKAASRGHACYARYLKLLVATPRLSRSFKGAIAKEPRWLSRHMAVAGMRRDRQRRRAWDTLISISEKDLMYWSENFSCRCQNNN